MPNYPYSFQLPPLNVQDIPSNGVAGEFLGISAGGVLDWLPVSASGSGDMLKSENLSGLANYTTARTNIGLGTTDSPTFANLTLTSPSLSSSAPVTISQTWNNAAVAFTGVKVNAVNTASAAASLLLDLQVGGVSQFNVNKLGNISFPGRYSTASIATQTNSFAAIKSNYGGGIGAWMFGGQDVGSTVALAGDYIGFNGIRVIDTSTSDNIDTRLYRDSASGNTLALRNGEAPQTFRLYNTYSAGGVNFERLNIQWSGGAARIFPDAGGTGTLKTVYLGSDSVANNAFLVNGASNLVQINTSGVERMRITSAGNVGIGTTAPGAKLQVSYANQVLTGNVTDLDVSAKHHIAAYTPDTAGINVGASLGLGGCYLNNTNYITFGAIAGRKELATNNNAQGYLSFLTASNGGGLIERMRIDSVGNLGIGTTSPTSKLQVSAGDVEVDTIAKGVILKSPDGTRYRVTVANGGTLSVAAV